MVSELPSMPVEIAERIASAMAEIDRRVLGELTEQERIETGDPPPYDDRGVCQTCGGEGVVDDLVKMRRGYCEDCDGAGLPRY